MAEEELPDYDRIAGTKIFDARRSRQGYKLNMFCMSLMDAKNREAFKADERGYLASWKMTPEQERAILERDWNGMLELGGNIYYTSKLGATDGLSFRALAALMTSMTEDAYAAMMLAGGRPHDASVKEASATNASVKEASATNETVQRG